MAWLQLEIAVDRDFVDAVSDALEAAGAVAVTLTGAGEETVLEPPPGGRPLWREVRLQALYEPDVSLRAVRGALEPMAARLVDVEFVAADDWQERWRAHAPRASFGGRLRLLPRGESTAVAASAAGEEVVLRLDPGLAFGSGSHPTTRLCLEGLAGTPLAGARVLDFGCGSGILAVAAGLLGAHEVVAVDHDPQALLATRDNAAYNGVEQRLRVTGPDELADFAPFDVVVANILANPLVELAPLLTALTAPDGLLMLSGLLVEQTSMIRDSYPGVEFAPAAREGDWIRLDGRVARDVPAR